MTQIRLIVVFMSGGYCVLSIGLQKLVCVCVGRETERHKERVRVGVGTKVDHCVFSSSSVIFLDSRRAVGAFDRSRLEEGSLFPQRRRRGQVFILNLHLL